MTPDLLDYDLEAGPFTNVSAIAWIKAVLQEAVDQDPDHTAMDPAQVLHYLPIYTWHALWVHSRNDLELRYWCDLAKKIARREVGKWA